MKVYFISSMFPNCVGAADKLHHRSHVLIVVQFLLFLLLLANSQMFFPAAFYPCRLFAAVAEMTGFATRQSHGEEAVLTRPPSPGCQINAVPFIMYGGTMFCPKASF